MRRNALRLDACARALYAARAGALGQRPRSGGLGGLDPIYRSYRRDRKLPVLTLSDRQYSNDCSSDLELNRSRLLKLGVGSIGAVSLPGGLLHAQSAPQSCAPPIPPHHPPSNGTRQLPTPTYPASYPPPCHTHRTHVHYA